MNNVTIETRLKRSEKSRQQKSQREGLGGSPRGCFLRKDWVSIMKTVKDGVRVNE